MPATDTVPIGQLNVVQIKTDPVTGRRVVMARVPSGQRLYEWREDNTAHPLTPVDKAVQHWTVHSNRLLAHHSRDATEIGPIWAYDLTGDPPAGAPIDLPESTLIGGLQADENGIVVGMGDGVHTTFYKLDQDLRPTRLWQSVGGVSMVTSVFDDTAIIAEPVSADRSGFYDRQLREISLSDPKVTYSYPPAKYNYWRSSNPPKSTSHHLIAFNDLVTAHEVAPDGELVPNQYVGIWMRDRRDPKQPTYQLTGAPDGEPDPHVLFPDDRLPVGADLSPCGWLPGGAERLLAFAQHAEDTALYVVNADNSGVTKVKIPEGLNVETVTEPGNALTVAASHFLSPDHMMVRFSGHRHKPGWLTVDTVTGETSEPPEGFTAPQFDPESPTYFRGKTWLPEEKRYREYTVFLPDGMTVEKAKAQGGIAAVKYEFGGPWHAQAGVYSAEPKRYTDRGVGFVTYTRRGSTTIGFNDYPTLEETGFMRPGERDGEGLMTVLTDQEIVCIWAGLGRSHGGAATNLGAAYSKLMVCAGTVAAAVDSQAMGEDSGVPVLYKDDADRDATQARRRRAAAHPMSHLSGNWWIAQSSGVQVYWAPNVAALDYLPARIAHLIKIPTMHIANAGDIRAPAAYIKILTEDVNSFGGNAIYVEVGGGHNPRENGSRAMVDMAAKNRGEPQAQVNPLEEMADFLVGLMNQAMDGQRAKEGLALAPALRLGMSPCHNHGLSPHGESGPPASQGLEPQRAEALDLYEGPSLYKGLGLHKSLGLER